jgi:hypothetical protein
VADDDEWGAGVEPVYGNPDNDSTMILPPATYPDPVDPDDEQEPPPPPPVEGTTALGGLAADGTDDSYDPAVRSPWSPAPTTSFSPTPASSFVPTPRSSQSDQLDTEITGPVPTVHDAPVPVVQDWSAAPAPTSTVAVLPPVQTEQVTCPECGTVAMVTLTRREAADFCRSCDYPLFWTPSIVLLDRATLADDSLRRLPGTVGRVTVAHLPCPHCSEPNQVTAIDCIRCGRPLRPVHYEPAPIPVYLPPPPEPEPERGIPWWVWFAVALMVITVTLILLYAYDAWPFD